MIEHVVLIKVADGTSRNAIDDLLAHVSDLKSIPGIIEAYAGLTLGNNEWGIGLVVRLESKKALDGYLTHPTHEKFAADYVRPIRAQSMIIDLELRPENVKQP